MPLSTTGRNAALNGLDESITAGAKYLSAHSAYSATGTNEATGGTPAYIRKAAVWDPAASGAKALNADVTLDIPAAFSVAFIGEWDAESAGNFLGMAPNGSAAAKVFVMPDSAADTIYCIGHGFADTNTVCVFGAALPTGLTAGTIYYVRDSATDSFKLAATSGGAAINTTTVGSGTVQKVVVETFAAQGQFTVKAASTSLDGAVI